ncbi:MAG: exo-beta-N-acetylmuramidase NamZ domain-containing protein [Bradymonadaceae bacterium]
MTSPNSPSVQTGLDRLLDDPGSLDRLKPMRVGLLVNPTSVTAGLVHAIEAFQARGVTIVRLFGPEHGVRADAQDMEAVDETRDPISGIPTISLYGHDVESLTPNSAHLEDLDIVICDIQDIGSRYYTYVYTIGLMMKACGQAGVKVLVLDRPNPITGIHIEGNVVLDDFRSFVGMQPIATRHAMTAGELSHFFNRFTDWTCELEISELRGWKRSMWFDDTGLPWVMPSPNMPTLDTATVYPGQCLLEGTTASEARGTTRPFELFGAPYVDAVALTKYLDGLDLPGVAWRLAAYRPQFQKHAHETCRGLQLHVTDRERYDSLATGYAIIAGLYHLFGGDFQWREQAYEFVADRLAIDLLLGDDSVRFAIEDGQDPVEVARAGAFTREEFEARRLECLLYNDTE